MRLYSTNHQSPVVSFQQALLTGQAPDGGLYMPEELPAYYDRPEAVAAMQYTQFALDISIKLLESEINARALADIIRQAYDFRPEMKKIDDRTFCLELFHGPTFSFKDFGAQFMAKTMGYFIRDQHLQLTILVATSGDTGSAVAHAFYKVDGIRVVMLYPAGQVSPLQEKQLTTLGDNITVLEVEGTFDDCQALVKRAFADESIRRKINITSANSINIGRLIPQSFYYGWAVSRLLASGLEDIVVCVPSGNFGNLTGGLFAQKMGLAIKQFIAAVNSNDV
ncbi:MAG TPA: threonine synthase, partial [Planctomycetaceae bacterium]|nr:threonine synthase [Planctomycetaceae bacterium]